MLYRQQFFYSVLNFKFDSYNSVILIWLEVDV